MVFLGYANFPNEEHIFPQALNPYRNPCTQYLDLQLQWRVPFDINSVLINQHWQYSSTLSLDSSGILSPNQSLLTAESSSSNESATVGSNYSRECSDGFYLHQEHGSCRPQCGIWEVTSSTTSFALSVTALCLATISIVVPLQHFSGKRKFATANNLQLSHTQVRLQLEQTSHQQECIANVCVCLPPLT